MKTLEKLDVVLMDCGRASQETQGLPNLVVWENGFSPFNTFYYQLI